MIPTSVWDGDQSLGYEITDCTCPLLTLWDIFNPLYDNRAERKSIRAYKYDNHAQKVKYHNVRLLEQSTIDK